MNEKRFRQGQKRGEGDCLLKTQVSANSEEEVKGLTPARCLKDNWNCASKEGKDR